MTARRTRRLLLSPLTMLAAALVLLLAGQARASLVAPLTVEEMTAISEEIVHVKIGAGESAVYKGLIYTTHQAEVLDVLKGDRKPGAKLELATPGGDFGPVSAVAPGAVQFAPGEEAVLFLSRPTVEAQSRGMDMSHVDQDSPLVRSPQVIGGFQGRFRVVRPATPEQIEADKELPARARPLRAPGDEAILMRENPGNPVRLEAAPALQEFKAQIRDTAAPQKARIIREIPLVGRYPVTPEQRDAKALRSFDPIPVFAAGDRLPDDQQQADFQAQRREMLRAELREAMDAYRDRTETAEAAEAAASQQREEN